PHRHHRRHRAAVQARAGGAGAARRRQVHQADRRVPEPRRGDDQVPPREALREAARLRPGPGGGHRDAPRPRPLTRRAAPGARPTAVVVAALLALLLLASATPAHAQPAGGDPACTPLTPRQLVGQVLGTAVGHPDPDAAGARTTVGEGLGTVVLLGGAVTSADQVRALTATLRDAAPAGLLVAVDEEGGRVARFGRAGL